MKILDKQFDSLPKDVRFCKNCVVSNQRPYTQFNEEGICSACQWSREKDTIIDWDLRERELRSLLELHRKSDGSFDCIVPGSGGKDSAFVAHQLRVKYGMNPLCVTWAPFDWTEIGWKNLKNFVFSGHSNIIAQPNGRVHRSLSRLAFELVGDAFVPFIYGQRAYAYHVARSYGIQLIFFGENGSLEYGGVDRYKYMPKEEPDEWAQQYFKGAELDQLVEEGLARQFISKEEATDQTLLWYKAIAPEQIAELGLEMHWYSYYKPWIPQENFYYAAQHTMFQTNNEGRSEGTYTKYASLDDRSDAFHFYLGYMKFGLGRASRDAQQDVRRHHITRDEAVRLVHRYDHEFPQKHFKWFLDYLNISEDFFWHVMDIYREKSNVWKKKHGVWKLTNIVT